MNTSNTSMEASVAENSFSQKWEEFVEENALDPVIAEKLQFVFYAGASAFNDAMGTASVNATTPANTSKALLAFRALQQEVVDFFEERDEEDMTILTVKENASGQADS